jgi:hypothetical protein
MMRKRAKGLPGFKISSRKKKNFPNSSPKYIYFYSELERRFHTSAGWCLRARSRYALVKASYSKAFQNSKREKALKHRDVKLAWFSSQASSE